MRELSRIDRIIEKVERVWNQNPDLRFVQLVSGTLAYGAELGVIRARDDYFYLEDNEFEKVLDKMLEEKDGE